MHRWKKFDLIVLDEVGYVPLADIGAEFMFQSLPNARNGPDRNDEPAVLRMDHGVPEPASLQGAAGSGHGPRTCRPT